ncbi:hypothetical protein L227DRAFT_325989 [Lentinus tigrinus ALCF2SS1-6]|uniref:Protein kinase domain-containing protein n=1 Tax=Lentinus tigrinus ALCF2SS1-6 TaxID=1328759 RepID=A0A5C2SMF9_9APHY|nr:hypothetical protein L227DRAFT_325989 [Lentinus tigrinus ALCF2SS1-6]
MPTSSRLNCPMYCLCTICTISRVDAVAHLYLAQQNRLGTGNHSTVFRAPFVLELDRGSGAVSRVSVAVKTTSAECGAHYMLHQEAVMYSTFPADLMDANGPDSPSGIRAAAPEAQEDMPADDVALAKTDQRNVASTEENRPPPVVPRFYGYYLPIGDDDTLICNTHSKCKEDGKCEVDWPSRILLVEECGTPIEPRDWTYQQRLECLSLYHRLHEAGFIQCSAYRRNILVQPGPLSVPRQERSFAAPSFQIIDFGRGEHKMIEREDDDGRRFER